MSDRQNTASQGTSKATRWTEAQLRGIQTTGHSLLVSAAAGSGKTSMLAERCAHLVCDAPDPCGVDELLVVTFTDSAAAEMKSRIHASLRDRLKDHESARLRKQLAIVDRASISTLHSFCARLLREHFHTIGLDPGFKVLDGDEAALMRREVARRLFDARYETDDEAGHFHRFIDAYGEGDDTRLISRVIQTHELLASLVDPAAWLDHSCARIVEAAEKPLDETALGTEMTVLLAIELRGAVEQCKRAIDLVGRLKHFPAYIVRLHECLQILTAWERSLREEGIELLRDNVLAVVSLEKLKPVPNDVPHKQLAKDAVDAIRDVVTKGTWRQWLRFSAQQWQQGLAATLPHAKVFCNLVDEFGVAYRRAKHAARSVDFSDLERLALKVLNDGTPSQLKPSAAARLCHRRFKHVLVDEYQDINQVQDAILWLVSRECVWEQPGESGNLFCVGDVKQSIYRFRLAEAGQFLERQKMLKSPGPRRRGEVVDLQHNFRSRAPLLEAINGIFERLMTEAAVDIEYDESHRLVPGLVYPTANAANRCFTGAPIELHMLPSELSLPDGSPSTDATDDPELDRSEREAVLAAQCIRTLVGSDKSPPHLVADRDASGQPILRPIRFSDIVILLRSIKYKSEQYANVLRKAGIPVHAQSGGGYFASTEIRDMLALLSVLDNQRRDIPLAALLRSPLANLPRPEELLAKIRLAFPLKSAPPVAFHDAVVKFAEQGADELVLPLATFLDQLERWRELAHRRPLAELLQTIFQETGYLAYCAGLHDGPQRVANLLELHERATHFGSFQRQSLSRFIEFLDSLREESDLGQPSIASEAENVVRVMSIHKSKGMEFPVVLLPDLGKRINLTETQGTILTDRKAGLGLMVVDEERMVRYPSLASVLVKQRLRQQALAEEMRVLYVAMTRAREHLILIGTAAEDAPAKWQSRWERYTSAFPSDMVLDSSCLLDWLGPTAIATSAGAKPVMRLVCHSSQEVAGWEATHSKRPVLSDQQQALAELRPLGIDPSVPAEARDALARLSFQYPFTPFTTLAASQSVTRRAKGGKAPGDRPESSQASLSRELPRPRFLEQQAMTAADIGTATHLVLQHLDFARPCDADDVSSQIASLIDRRLISPAQADAVSHEVIEWFMASEIGALVRRNASKVRRELPFNFATVAPNLGPPADPQDRVMVRGRIDALVLLDDGPVVIDYKTDSISPSYVPFRAREYVPQMEDYRGVVEKITGKSVSEIYLVFLTPRVIWKCSDKLPEPTGGLF
jgi:ATP-dependent helicase/nuclease subunit A